jgi:outer membrane receptor protein involved in Fe transport
VVDLDTDYKFQIPGFESAQLQVTISNLFDEEYFGTISSGVGGFPPAQVQCVSSIDGTLKNCGNSGVGFFGIGAPRTIVASFKVNF